MVMSYLGLSQTYVCVAGSTLFFFFSSPQHLKIVLYPMAGQLPLVYRVHFLGEWRVSGMAGLSFVRATPVLIDRWAVRGAQGLPTG